MYWLIFAILIVGLLETGGIASIMPFMAVLSSPQMIETNPYLSYTYTVVGTTNSNQFLFFLGSMVLLVLIISNTFSAITNLLLYRFIYFRGHGLSCRLFREYLHAPYSFFLNHNSADLVKNIITENHRVVVGVISPIMQIITRVIVALCIFSLLIFMDPLLAIIIFSVCGGLYGIIYKISKKTLAASGQKAAEAQGMRFKLAGEAFGGIKELKLLGRESEYLKRYTLPSYNFAACESKSQAITFLPKFALETIIFGGILLIMLYLIGIKKDMANVLPMLSLYAFAGYRLTPAFNNIFNALSQIRYHSASLDIILNHIQLTPVTNSEKNKSTFLNKEILLRNELTLQNITFSYPKSSSKVIEDLNLVIQANTNVAFVGKTGSGKTTLFDLILGLLTKNTGEIFVDDHQLTDDNLHLWQQNIGYVPQQIYLADDTVSRNIALGVPDEEINNEAIIQAAKLADLHNFVTKDLPQDYSTNLGERGVRLSGGQRQRIGIARALYHDPEILVLDEATSALDGLTENVIMQAIHNLSHKKTVIIIAHRLATIKECDVIHVLDHGHIIASGTYNELMTSCPDFNKMKNPSNRH
ncbi:MAG: ABC transporter ATP-binding protein/permease [Desulfobulbaceae bacterium]|nr:ABC transporter ATP-binding protein/permease [Desulfobulbaceae bacterium]